MGSQAILMSPEKGDRNHLQGTYAVPSSVLALHVLGFSPARLRVGRPSGVGSAFLSQIPLGPRRGVHPGIDPEAPVCPRLPESAWALGGWPAPVWVARGWPRSVSFSGAGDTPRSLGQVQKG